MITKEVFIHRAILTATAMVMLFMLFTIGRNLIHALVIRCDISILEEQAETYRTYVERDSTLLEELKFDDRLEKYAREQYRMQRRGERVYIIEE